MKLNFLFILVFAILSFQSGIAQINPIKLDINAPGATVKAGYTNLNANASSPVTTQGVRFTLFGYASNKYRDRNYNDDMLRDFAFNEGVQNAAVGIRIENLPAGVYTINSWHFDKVVSSGNIRIEYRKQGQSGSVLVSNFSFKTAPASYTITSDGTSTYELVFRENDGGNRSRFNGITLTSNSSQGNTNQLATYQLDINAPGAPVKSGFVALNAQAGTSVTDKGVKFTLFGYPTNNYRDRTTPSDLLRDFAFNEGTQNAAVRLRVENLPAGTYDIRSWHYDGITSHTGKVKIEYGKQGQAATVLVNSHSFTTSPANYSISSDGSSTYEFVFRENSNTNRSRFNGIRLEQTSTSVIVTTTGTPPPNTEVIANDGVWTWFNDERAIFHQGFLYSGYVLKDGRIGVTQYNPITKVKKETIVSTSRSQDIPDDHNNPSFTVLPNNHLLILYSRHANRQEFYYRISNNTSPEGLADWSEEFVKAMPSNRGHTYCNTYRLSNENKIYNFSRNLNFDPTLTVSGNNGQSWGTPIHFIETNSSFQRPYVNYTSNLNDRIDLIYTDAHPDVFNTSLYHMYYSNGTFKKTNGTHIRSLNTLPILHDNGERGSIIYNYSSQAWGAGQDADDWIPNGRAWTWDVECQADGKPVAAFQVRTNNRIYYYYARWNGSSWQKKFIAHGGRPLYSAQANYGGGMTIDPDNPNIVYISSNAASPFNLGNISSVPLRNNERYEIWKGVTNDGGQTFSWSAITANSPKDNLRPIVPANHGYTEHALWFYGDYTTYEIYDTQVVGVFNGIIDRDQTFNPLEENSEYEIGINLYPNPIDSEKMINLDLSLPKSETAEVFITDVTGKVLYQKTLELEEGQLSTTIQGPSRAGMYFLRVKGLGKSKTKAFVVQRL